MFNNHHASKINLFLCCRKKLAFRKTITMEPFHQPNMHVVIALFYSLLSMCYIASIFHVLTRCLAATFHVADFSDDE